MSWACCILSLAFALLSTSTASTLAADYKFRVVHLPPLSDNFVPYYVNDRGHALIYRSSLGEYDGFEFWSPETGYMWIRTPNGKTVDTVYNINNHDQVAAYGDGKSFIWTPTGTEVLEPPDGYESIFAKGINDDGLIVGRVRDSNDTLWSFHRTSKGKVVVHVDEGPSCIDQLSKNGTVLVMQAFPETPYCSCNGNRARHGYVIRDGKRREVTVPGSDDFCATDVNDAGQVLIYSPDSGLWSPKTGYKKIEIEGWDYFPISGLTNEGVVAGNAEWAKPFLWHPQKGARWLEDLVELPRFFRVWGVSPRGVLAGDAEDHPVVLMPVRKPGD